MGAVARGRGWVAGKREVRKVESGMRGLELSTCAVHASMALLIVEYEKPLR